MNIFVKKEFMKKSILITALILPAAFLIFSSNSAGPASSGNGIRNGGPLSNGTCGSCHSGGSGTTSINLSVVEKSNGNAANGIYKPGVVYTVTLSGNNANLAFFGFQVSAANAAQQQAGSFGNLGADKHSSNLSGLQIVEHNTTLSKVNGAYTVSFDWTAPAAGNGTVTLYGIINAVNNNDEGSGDKVSAPATISLNEQSTGIDDVENDRSVKLYPNPASDVLHIATDQRFKGNYNVRILDINGRVVYRDNALIVPSKDITISVKDLRTGLYFLRMDGEGQKISRSFTIK
jgi:hypothetical protein